MASSLLSPRTYETAFWYGTSSLLYCAIYLGTTDEDSNLHWINYFSGDRARLNERPVFLACYMITFALIQTVEHYRHDTDRLDLGALERKPAVEQKNTGIISGSLQAVLEELPMALAECFKLALMSIPATLILYFFFLRSFAWSWTLTFLRPFYNLPRTNMLPSSWPSDIYLLARCVLAGVGVGFLWAAGNRAFSIFMVKKPLKNDNPLTSDSKDPNGSLLNGLKSKKLSIKVRIRNRVNIMYNVLNADEWNHNSPLPCGNWPSQLKTMDPGGKVFSTILTAKVAPCGLRYTQSAWRL